jgi:hypothetical protein
MSATRSGQPAKTRMIPDPSVLFAQFLGGLTAAMFLDAYERLLGDIQAAYSTEDLSALRAKVTPEMLSCFSEQLAANASRGLINRVTDVKLLQGDLAEAWRESGTAYATVAMKFANRIVDLHARSWRQLAALSHPADLMLGTPLVCDAAGVQ